MILSLGSASVLVATAAMRSVVVSAIVEVVFVTRLTGYFEGAVEKALYDRIRIFALDAENDLDAVLREDVDGAWAHAAREDHRRALLA